MITTGNHVYRHREAYEFLDRAERVIRPANYPHANPGKGHVVVEAGGMRVGVINLSGAIGLQVARLPFHEVDAILERIEADCVVVDFHAEVSSEKVAIGGTSTAGSPPSSAPTPTSPPPTAGSSPAAPPTSPTSA